MLRQLSQPRGHGPEPHGVPGQQELEHGVVGHLHASPGQVHRRERLLEDLAALLDHDVRGHSAGLGIKREIWLKLHCT